MDFLLGLFTGAHADWSVIVLALIVLSGSAMLAGASYAAALSLSLPVALVLYDAIAQSAIASTIGAQFPLPLEQAIIFVIIEAILFACIRRVIFTSHSTSPLAGFIAGLAATAVVVTIWIQVPALQSLWHFGPQIQSIFGAHYRFWWILGAYVALAFAGS